jgi:hypothetical protein
MPMKIRGGSGAPARVTALVRQSDFHTTVIDDNAEENDI